MIETPIILIDLFSGAGGVSTGADRATINGKKAVTVLAAVNHDELAIASHRANHPHTTHFVEDIRTLNLSLLSQMVARARAANPNALVIVWASLECTNFSKAKGGLPRDADSRTLADHMDRYIVALKPDIFYYENVVEFMSWGPLDEKGKPISKTSGKDYILWVNRIQRMGYVYEKRVMNSANFGAYTSRERLFGQFVRPGMPIIWPQATHSKKPVNDQFGVLRKYNAVRQVLDLNDWGSSIFDRKKPLVENTLERILAGLHKFVAKGESQFLQKYYSGKPEGKVISTDVPSGAMTTTDSHAMITAPFLSRYNTVDPRHTVVDIDSPCGTLTTDNRFAICTPYLLKYNSTSANGEKHNSVASIDEPSPVVSTQGRMGMVTPFMVSYYSNSRGAQSIDSPAPTIPTTDRVALVNPQFISRDFTSGDNTYHLDQPAGSLLANPKMNLITPFIVDQNFRNPPKSVNEPATTVLACRKHHYLVNPQYASRGCSIEAPAPVVIARQDKMPLSFATAIEGQPRWTIAPGDSPMTIRIKEFMQQHGIADIYYRMLHIHELKRIMGFGDHYILQGTQADQKKFIGNAVECTQAQANFEAIARYVFELRKTA